MSSHRAFILVLAVWLTPQFALATKPSTCVKDFSAVAAGSAASARPGAIPEFTPFFKPVLSRAELERQAENLPIGAQVKKFSEQGFSTWSVDKLSVQGRPQVVAVKRTTSADESKNETKILNAMSDVFKTTGVDQYFHVARPLETGERYAVYPLFEARDMLGLSREATAKISKKKFRTETETGGPVPQGTDPHIERIWARFQEGVEFAVTGLRKAGFNVERIKKKSMTTGESYVDSILVYSRLGTESEDVISFSIRSSDILVTTDGRFVIIDPY